MPTFLSTFKVDVTPPLGSGLCGGWIKPAGKIGTPLYCIGIVLQGPDAPIVMAALDWTGLLNESHMEFTQTIAKAAHTTPERVALHCVHQHNAPFIDMGAQKYVSEQSDLPPSFDVKWFREAQQTVARAIETSLTQLKKVTHFSLNKGRVDRIASNRRIIKDGKVTAWRGSACKDARLRDLPEGEIDPWLKTIAFWNEETKLVSLHWYATHPMSYYGDGIVNSDFVGLAREKCAEEDEVPHIYFTGCAGNIAAGKYNDGAPERRAELADRLHKTMAANAMFPDRVPLQKWEWRSTLVKLPVRKEFNEESLKKTIADKKESVANRIRAAMQLSYLKRVESGIPITLNGLLLNRVSRIIHLPGECFIEYQLYARYQLEESFICCAAYGDGGPWYIPTADAYPQGGYEVTASWVDSASEVILQEGIKHFLRL
ncbi:MAG TPA: hypothetical protein PLN21_12635 [Gemmatales bacterium]|nr:hypothetical protein [Gemmatales bacterium]